MPNWFARVRSARSPSRLAKGRESDGNMALEGFGLIAERLRRSTVQVASGWQGQGSGFIVKSDGVIVTNAHVVGNSNLMVRLWDGTSFPASLQARSTRRD